MERTVSQKRERREDRVRFSRNPLASRVRGSLTGARQRALPGGIVPLGPSPRGVDGGFGTPSGQNPPSTGTEDRCRDATLTAEPPPELQQANPSRRQTTCDARH